MSTKTTFKRIALVAVAALGLGVLSTVAPANATGRTAASGTALFKITVKDDATTTANTGLAAGETITATIVGVPAGTGTAKTLAANGVVTSDQSVNADLQLVSLTVPTTRTGAFVGATATRLRPNEATATSATRLKVVFVDICFLSISRSEEFPPLGFG